MKEGREEEEEPKERRTQQAYREHNMEILEYV